MNGPKLLTVVGVAAVLGASQCWRSQSAEVQSASARIGEGAPADTQPFVQEMQSESAAKLKRFGQLLAAYAADHGGTLPAKLADRDDFVALAPYATPKDFDLGHFVLVNVKYVATEETGKERSTAVMVAYDQSLLRIGDGTNALFADGHVEFVKADRLAALGIEPGQKVRLAGAGASYETSLPEPWKPYLRAGKLTVVGPPCFAVRSKHFGASQHVRIQWSFENLTAEPIEVTVQYKSQRITGGGTTGFGVAYGLAPHQQRVIDDIIPVVTAKVPVVFFVTTLPLRHAGREIDLPAGHRLVTTDPLLPGRWSPEGRVAKDEKTSRVRVEKARLECSQAEGNVLQLEVVNLTDKELPLVLYAAVRDRERSEGGPVAETSTTVAPNGKAVLRLPYSVPTAAPDPVLAFTLFEPLEESAPVDDRVRHDITPVHWGWFDLRQAAGQGLAKIPDYVPAQERAKLSAEKRSKHFLFRYRPGSYAEQRIETAIEQREQAYQRLSTLLRTELPKTVTIDLYPDMEAKGIGSGTYYTPANTVSETHIAEVYNEGYQCDRYHELAHLFAYYLPGYGEPSGGRGLVEGFAEYFEADRVRVGPAREGLRQRLAAGKLEPLGEVLLSPSRIEATDVLIDFLIRNDVERFKQLYVRALHAQGLKDLEKACREIYGTGLKELELQWHKDLAQAPDAAGAEEHAAAAAPAEAVVRAFKGFQDSIRDEKHETAWGLLGRNLRSQYQDDFSKWKQVMSSNEEVKSVFLDLRTGPVTESGEVLTLHATHGNQAWKILFVRENDQWKIHEAQVQRGN